MSESKKKRYDKNSPEAKGLIDEIMQGAFMKEGTMAAFPACFPGVTIPIPADESHITALGESGDGMVYGGTSGRRAHLFVAIFHWVTGVVFDRGTVTHGDQSVAVCCGKKNFAACVNGPDGGRVLTAPLEPLPFDLIQEWEFQRPALQDLGKVDGERIAHAVVEPSKGLMVGVTEGHLFTVDIDAGKVEMTGEVPGRGQIGLGSKGGFYGQDGSSHLWRYEVGSRQLHRRTVKLPRGEWERFPLRWARDHQSGLLYTADGKGTLFSFDESRGFSAALGATMLAPVGPMAVTHDGRVFGACGDGIAKLFCYNPQRREVKNLGVAVSTLERRRYGYVFGDAVTGRDGQIIFGEDDDLGHLWLYFPKIEAARR
jgi:hypothetical protein